MLADIFGAGLESVLHVALGFIDPAVDLRDGEVMLSRDLSDRGLALKMSMITAALRFTVYRLMGLSLLILSS
ncbi:hypothetical protein [Chromohalobacter sp. 296-RDG]|uniref:hypothetical protein n=1 Tax=Chromohalobacter sp. 296-RDG TaxID=2994062 RepID=UPI0024688C23|nr:hypothetical protein [Chromohalobacter sp. 296-RDG]